MKTLTITDAKKNLGKWLTAAVNGEDIGIISGADIIALKPIEVRPAHPLEIREIDYDYARKEYGTTKAEVDRFKTRVDAEYKKAKLAGTLVTIENPTFEKIEKALSRPAPAPARNRRAATQRASRRVVRAV